MQIKLHQYKHYKMSEINKYKIIKNERNKYKIKKYQYLVTFKKNSQCHDLKSKNVMLDL